MSQHPSPVFLSYGTSDSNSSVARSIDRTSMISSRRLSDKANLLRPLHDEHLLEVYKEAKKMNLSAEFIELLEEAISMRQIVQQQKA